MLPFLKRKDASTSGLIVKDLTPNKPNEPEQQDDSRAAHEACARHLLLAIEARDVKAMADALYDAFTVMESEPHEENSEPSPHSYDAQNIKAGEQS